MNHEIDNKDAVVLRPAVRIADDTNHILPASYRWRAILWKHMGLLFLFVKLLPPFLDFRLLHSLGDMRIDESLSSPQFIFFISMSRKKVYCNKLFLDAISCVKLKASAKLRDLSSAFYNRLCVLWQNKGLDAASIVEREALADPQFNRPMESCWLNFLPVSQKLEGFRQDFW